MSLDLWKAKLAAYLHDPPSKCLDIATHGERSEAAFRQAGFQDTEVGEYIAHADHSGAAADRLPFPHSRAAGLQCAFDGRRNRFRHPLSGSPLEFQAEFKSAEQGFEAEGAVQPVLSGDSLGRLADEAGSWRARFFGHWRLWPKHATETDHRFAFLPADTRIPDHTIWTHMQVVSALAGCLGKDKVWRPAFLKVQLGPVQDFIAAARSTRDLWSGSYLLSWLMAAGLKALSVRVGPDAVVFPNLRGQPLFDLQWRDDLWSRISINDAGTVWDSLAWKAEDLLTPNLPNVFLAVVPADDANALAEEVVGAIRAEWKRIADAVWKYCAKAGLTADEGDVSEGRRKERFDSQVERFLSISWRATAWPETLDGALALAGDIAKDTPVAEARERVRRMVEMAEQKMPFDHRDRRFFTDDTKSKLSNVGLGWSVLVALNSWELDAVRQTRAFVGVGAGGWSVGTFSNKDALTGCEEAVAGGKTWGDRCQGSEVLKMRFKKADWVGGITLIKRLWDVAYLQEQWGLPVQRMPNTRGIAAHDRFAKEKAEHDDARSEKDVEDQEESGKEQRRYFAVLALDGDEIGKWISGARTPPFSSQLAAYSDGSGNPTGALEYFTRNSDPDGRGALNARYADFLASQRPLSPSYHLQFSEALGNFALLCARPIVEAYDGRLIYAGGDDVVALLPADTALGCAVALRDAFQGRQVVDGDGEVLFASLAPGFLSSERWKDGHGRLIPFLVPGPEADCSVGIAMAHFKAPLQDIVRAARAAEKRAKRDASSGGEGRSAFAVTLMKRSGETIEWGGKWKGGLELYRAMVRAMDRSELTGRFPYRLVELLEGYLTEAAPLQRELEKDELRAGAAHRDFPVRDIILLEFDHCLRRQREPRSPAGQDAADGWLGGLREAAVEYLHSLTAAGVAETEVERRLRAFIGLCQTVAFAHRTAVGPDTNPEPKGSS